MSQIQNVSLSDFVSERIVVTDNQLVANGYSSLFPSLQFGASKDAERLLLISPSSDVSLNKFVNNGWVKLLSPTLSLKKHVIEDASYDILYWDSTNQPMWMSDIVSSLRDAIKLMFNDPNMLVTPLVVDDEITFSKWRNNFDAAKILNDIIITNWRPDFNDIKMFNSNAFGFKWPEDIDSLSLPCSPVGVSNGEIVIVPYRHLAYAVCAGFRLTIDALCDLVLDQNITIISYNASNLTPTSVSEILES